MGMNRRVSSIEAFFALLRAGLWADTRFTESWKHGFAESVDWGEVYLLAEEQSVVGLALAGIDCFKVHDLRLTVPQEVLLHWIGEAQLIEQQNKVMNEFCGLFDSKAEASRCICYSAEGSRHSSML